RRKGPLVPGLSRLRSLSEADLLRRIGPGAAPSGQLEISARALFPYPRKRRLGRGPPHGLVRPGRAPAGRKDVTTMDDDVPASRLIDDRLKTLGDWRGEALARVRALIHEADPEVIETVKWRKPTNPSGVP